MQGDHLIKFENKNTILEADVTLTCPSGRACRLTSRSPVPVAELVGHQVINHRQRVLVKLRHEDAQLQVAVASVADSVIVARCQDVDAMRKLTLNSSSSMAICT